MRSRIALTAPLFVLMACTTTTAGSSGGVLEPGAGNDPGTQAGTLVVSWDIGAWPSHPNASVPSEFTTSFRVTSPDSVELLKDATVTVTSATGKTRLYQLDGHLTGYWTGDAPGYDKVYVLDVVASTGKAEGIRVEGPAIHVFTRPAQGATIDPTNPTIFAWDSSERADTAVMLVDVTSKSGVWFDVDDSGEHSVAPDVFARAAPGASQHRVALERANTGALKGDNELWRAGIVNEINVMTPSL